MKVLFLDCDGVLNSHAFVLANPGTMDHADWVRMLDPIACARLACVVERTGCAIVISSSWRIAQSLESMRDLLARRGVVADVVGMTPTHVTPAPDRRTGVVPKHERGHEIQAWLDAWDGPPIAALAIVDDGSDMAHLRDRLVQTSWEFGLLDTHVDALCALLGEDA